MNIIIYLKFWLHIKRTCSNYIKWRNEDIYNNYIMKKSELNLKTGGDESNSAESV
jgi:hypothetical protein